MLHPASLLVLCTLLLAPLGLRAEDSAVITLADQPLRLIRAASVHKASAGVAVQAGDLLETTEAAAQIEIAQGSIVALAADTRIYWQASGSSAQLYVLRAG